MTKAIEDVEKQLLEIGPYVSHRLINRDGLDFVLFTVQEKQVGLGKMAKLYMSLDNVKPLTNAQIYEGTRKYEEFIK